MPNCILSSKEFGSRHVDAESLCYTGVAFSIIMEKWLCYLNS